MSNQNNTSRRNSWIWKLPFLVLLILGTIFIIRKQSTTPYIKNSGMVFGTFYNITYQSNTDLQKQIEEVLALVDQSLSPFNEKSIITAVNNNEDVEVNDIFKDVFQTAMKISKETQGDFDITVSPLVNIWGFGFKHDLTPDSAKIDSLREFVGYQKVKLVGNKVVKQDSRIMLDCSSIAKGYGVDAVGKFLDKKGIRNYMVEIGGEVITKGISPRKADWRIGISKPIEDSLAISNELEDIITLKDEGMATSGNYRNFYYKDGKRYAHTIDPHTGYPVQHNLLSATVICGNCTLADAYATSFMVMGYEKALKFLETHNNLTAYFIYSNEKGETQVYYSPSLKSRLAHLSEEQ